ncbi:MAG: hypothetical protein ACK4PC_05005 [Sphingopyxis sp.]
MILLFRTAAAAFVVATGLALSGCTEARDPASEAPATLLAGQYKVSIGGDMQGGMPFASKVARDEQDGFCLAAGYGEDVPEMLVRQHLGMTEGCSLDATPRQGNAFSGKLSCPTDPERAAGGSFDITYSGAVSTDRVDISGQVKIELPDSVLASMTPEEAEQIKQGQAAMDKLTISVTAERTGACS